MENKLARDPGPVEDLHSGSTSFAPSCNPTPGPDLVPAAVSAPTPAPAATNDLFKQFMKAYLKLNQGPRQPLAEYK